MQVIAELNGNDSGPGSLRNGITQANNSASPNVTIEIQNNVTQILMSSMSQMLTITRSLTITYLGQETVLIKRNAPQIGQNRGIFRINAENLIITINNLEITGGNSGDTAGAIDCRNPNTTLNLNNCIIHSNISRYNGGGGIYINGNLNMIDCQIYNNTCHYPGLDNGGAGVYIVSNGVSAITDCHMHNNSGSNGGSVFLHSGTLTITNCNINNNTAIRGGGVYVRSGAVLNLVETQITDNISQHLVQVSNTYGAGVYSDGSLNILDCVLSNNSSNNSTMTTYGGAIYSSGTSSIKNSAIMNNHSTMGSGGGIYNTGDISISYSDIQSNTSEHPSTLFYGGGIYNIGTITMNNSTVNVNHSQNGAGIYNGDTAMANVSYSTIDGNVANSSLSESHGAGIYNSGNFIITYSTISGNTSQNGPGGGIYKSGSSILSLTNSTISGNISTDTGGGIHDESTSEAHSFIIINCTISNNVSIGTGAGIYTNQSLILCDLKNTIVAANLSTTNPDFSGDANSASANNIIGNKQGSNFNNGINDNIVGDPGSPIDPMLNPLGDYGGPTMTMTLKPNSPAFNTGNDNWIDPSFIYDQRGTGYPRFRDNTINIGAIEGTVICYSGESLILTKNISTGEIGEIKAKHVYSDKHLVFNSITETFIPIKLNIVTGPTKRYMKILKDSLGDNKPNANFYVTSGHKLIIDGSEIKARDIPCARKVRVKSQKIYSICTEERVPIKVNNLDVMTWAYDEWMIISIKRGVNWIDNVRED